jgi:hypothetical protein
MRIDLLVNIFATADMYRLALTIGRWALLIGHIVEDLRNERSLMI